MPALLGHTSRGHVAIEHDVYAWEAWLILRWLVNSTPDGTLAHWLGRRCRLTPKLYIKLPYICYTNTIAYIITCNTTYIMPRSEGLLNCRLAHICAALVYQLYIYISLLWRPNWLIPDCGLQNLPTSRSGLTYCHICTVYVYKVPNTSYLA